MSTLIYHGGALGDFITTLPMISRWRTRHPKESICLLTGKRHAKLAMQARLADSWWDIDSAETASLFSERPKSHISRKLAMFDYAFIFASPDSPVISNVQAAGVKSIFSQPPFPADRTNVVDYHLRLLPFEPNPDLPHILLHGIIKPEDIIRDKGVILHPGSGSDRKNWPEANFLKLADHLRDRDITFSWLLGPAEQYFRIPSRDSVIREDSLVKLAGLLSGASVFVGNDSGISHLCASLGVRSIVLFGPSDSAVWAPRGEHVSIIRGLCDRAPCHPGDRPKECDGRCMKSIPIEPVLKSVVTEMGK